MRGLDTNVLLRLFKDDNPSQHARARSFFEDCESRGELLFVSIPVLCELVWTLKGPKYRLRREALAEILEELLARGAVVVEDSDVVRLAIGDFRHGNGDFADYLIGRLARRAGCPDTVTFDEALVEDNFTQLDTTYPTDPVPPSYIHEGRG